MANLDPRGMNGRIYVGSNIATSLNLSALGLIVSEKKILECFI